MSLDVAATTRWVVTNQHLHAMNEAAQATITAARVHQDAATLAAVEATMAAYSLLLLQWGAERGMALGDVSDPGWQPGDHGGERANGD